MTRLELKLLLPVVLALSNNDQRILLVFSAFEEGASSISASRVAALLGISPGTVRNRVEHLQRNKLLALAETGKNYIHAVSLTQLGQKAVQVLKGDF